MNQLDKENMQALRRIRNLGRLMILAAEKIEEQKKVRKEARERFRGLLENYPQAREVYYNE